MTKTAIDTDSLVTRAVQEYLAACRSGVRPDPVEFAARYPEIAPDLTACLDSLDFLEQLAEVDPLGAVAGAQPAADTAHAASRQPQPLGDFRIVREIGRGGMGVVYEAEQLSLRRRVALKVLPFAAVLDKRQKIRFQNEATAAASLHHPHIVPVYGIGQERGVHYYAMQYIEGRTLAQALERLNRGPLAPRAEASQEVVDPAAQTVDWPAAANASTLDYADQPTETESGSTLGDPDKPAYYRRIAEIGLQVAEALDYAHQHGIVHRDIKPSNLMLDEDGHVWVMDFGLAVMEAHPQLTMTGDLLGTLRYMSPEQATSQRDVLDHRTDIYSLGVTLYELLTLRPAYPETNRAALVRQVAGGEPLLPRSVNVRIPVDLETVVLKATATDAGRRYQTAGHFADDLHRFLDGAAISAKRPTLYGRLATKLQKHTGIALITLTVLLLLTLIVSLSLAIALTARREAILQQQRAEAEAIHKTKQFEHSLEMLDGIWRGINHADPQMRTPEQRIIREEAMSNAAGYYKSLIREPPQNAIDVEHNGIARIRLGDTYSAMDYIKSSLSPGAETAEMELVRGIESLERLPATRRDAPFLVRERAAGYRSLARLLNRDKSFASDKMALNRRRAYVALYSERSFSLVNGLIESGQANSHDRLLAARALATHAEALEFSGMRRQALEEYKAGADLCSLLESAQAVKLQYDCLMEASKLSFAEKDIAGALRYFREALVARDRSALSMVTSVQTPYERLSRSPLVKDLSNSEIDSLWELNVHTTQKAVAEIPTPINGVTQLHGRAWNHCEIAITVTTELSAAGVRLADAGKREDATACYATAFETSRRYVPELVSYIKRRKMPKAPIPDLDGQVAAFCVQGLRYADSLLNRDRSRAADVLKATNEDGLAVLTTSPRWHQMMGDFSWPHDHRLANTTAGILSVAMCLEVEVGTMSGARQRFLEASRIIAAQNAKRDNPLMTLPFRVETAHEWYPQLDALLKSDQDKARNLLRAATRRSGRTSVGPLGSRFDLGYSDHLLRNLEAALSDLKCFEHYIATSEVPGDWTGISEPRLLALIAENAYSMERYALVVELFCKWSELDTNAGKRPLQGSSSLYGGDFGIHLLEAARAGICAAYEGGVRDPERDSLPPGECRQYALAWLQEYVNRSERKRGWIETRRALWLELRGLLVDPVWAPVRDPDQLNTLEAKERQAWKQLWGEVQDLLAAIQ